jgi:hypothetical protein
MHVSKCLGSDVPHTPPGMTMCREGRAYKGRAAPRQVRLGSIDIQHGFSLSL